MTPRERILLRRKLDAAEAQLKVIRVSIAIDEEGSQDWEDTTLWLAKRYLEHKHEVAQAMVDACGDASRQD